MTRGPVAAQVDDKGWVRGLLDAEAALARAGAQHGLVPAEAAAAITRLCADPRLTNTDAGQRAATLNDTGLNNTDLNDTGPNNMGRSDASPIDIEALGAGAVQTGNPVIELLRQLRDRMPVTAAEHLHRGATSQDIMDTASMLISVRALAALRADLAGCAATAASLADRHRDSVLTGRTLMQAAVPTTFGLVAAGWLSGLDGVGQRAEAVARSLPAQLGGAVGVSQPVEVLRSFAEDLGLATPTLAWHTIRLPIADLAGLLATVSGVVAKVALDVVLLGQSEVAEVREQAPGRGGSSTMAHKANPVAAITARACAARAPGLGATLFAAMEQEHQRAAGNWHTEWVTLSDLFRCTGSAVAWLGDSLSHLVIDVDRMRANAEATGSAIGAGFSSEPLSGEFIDRALAVHARTSQTRTMLTRTMQTRPGQTQTAQVPESEGSSP